MISSVKLKLNLINIHRMKVEDFYNESEYSKIDFGSNPTLFSKKELLDFAKEYVEAINYSQCCAELKDGHKISFNDWLRVNCEPTKNKNLFIKNQKLQTRIELISMYEKE